MKFIYITIVIEKLKNNIFIKTYRDSGAMGRIFFNVHSISILSIYTYFNIKYARKFF